MRRAFDDKQSFINNNKDYKKFLQSSVDHFRSATNSKIQSYNIKVPSIIKNCERKAKENRMMMREIIQKRDRSHEHMDAKSTLSNLKKNYSSKRMDKHNTLLRNRAHHRNNTSQILVSDTTENFDGYRESHSNTNMHQEGSA